MKIYQAVDKLNENDIERISEIIDNAAMTKQEEGGEPQID